MHHYYVPKKAQGYVCKTDAHLQFDNADHIGTDAIYETYHRLFSEWKVKMKLLLLYWYLDMNIIFLSLSTTFPID